MKPTSRVQRVKPLHKPKKGKKSENQGINFTMSATQGKGASHWDVLADSIGKHNGDCQHTGFPISLHINSATRVQPIHFLTFTQNFRFL